jgi:1,4-dihydroxy-6-naphthoate synthase
LNISIAYSPDTDDAFMVHALRSGRLDTKGYTFSFVSDDIQKLNEAALAGTYDVTAISIAAYPAIASSYLLMPIGASVGDAFGPAIIIRQDSSASVPSSLAGKKIAIPGRMTSAYFAARALIGPFEEVPMPFYQIGDAVRLGEVDAGILIHELQLDCEEKGFKKLADLGRLWHARFGLPLPLGANAIRRSLGDKVIQEVTQLMRESIEVGLAHRSETLKEALAQSGASIGLDEGDRYISMYVNHRSLAFARDVRSAVTRLLGEGVASGLCPAYDESRAYYE